MNVSIRPATAGDAQDLHTMIVELARYERAESAVKVTLEDLSSQLSSPNPPFACAIAEVDHEVAGFALYFYAYSTWEGTRTLYLEDLYVRDAFRNAGAGLALMQFLTGVAREQECNRFEWSVLDWNEQAIKFYHKLGAKPLSGWTRYRMDATAIGQFATASGKV
ncbi:MAG TPA: GNAT family N-acetyltransferase [Planktothrix sp.]|jgi:GNAT superfamily N-acetyltransferase